MILSVTKIYCEIEVCQISWTMNMQHGIYVFGRMFAAIFSNLCFRKRRSTFITDNIEMIDNLF